MALSTVHITEATKEQLKFLSSKRKDRKDLAWAQRNIIAELVNKEIKRELNK